MLRATVLRTALVQRALLRASLLRPGLWWPGLLGAVLQWPAGARTVRADRTRPIDRTRVLLVTLPGVLLRCHRRDVRGSGMRRGTVPRRRADRFRP